MNAFGFQYKSIHTSPLAVFGVLLSVLSGQAALGQCETDLRAADGAMYDKLGSSVAISGSFAVAGAPQDSTSTASYVGAAYLFRWDGSGWVFHQKVVSSDGTANDRFGSAVAMDGDLLVVGAPYDGPLGVNSGSSYVFKRNDRGTPTNLADDVWEQKQKLQSSDGGAYDGFGSAVGISSNTVIIGAFRDGNPHDPLMMDAGPGAAFIFTSQNAGVSWALQQKLRASDGAAGARFGGSVAVYQDTAFVGAHLAADATLGTGAAYVFGRTGTSWTQRQKLQPVGTGPNTQFGTSVALHGGFAAVGDPFDDDRGTNFGSVSIYRLAGSIWVREAELNGSDAVLNQRFGASVAIHGSALLVGAPLQTPYWVEAGAAYLFKQNTALQWQEEAKLVPSDSYAYDNFGWSVGLYGDQLFAGSPGNSTAVYQAGAAYVMEDCSTSGGCNTDQECDDGNACTSDSCVSGECRQVSNSNACADDGNACTNDVCSNGTCTHPAKANGTACAADTNECTNDVCTSGVCTHPAKANGTACSDDGNSCTSDACSNGVCAHPNKAAGSACGNSTAGLCDNPDTCNGSGVCQANTVPNGTACSDDGNDCTNDTCSNGVCTHPAKANGTACADEGNSCTNDTCSNGVCGHQNKPAGSACGNPAAGLCDNPDSCNASGVCVANNLPNGTACADDGNECTNDTCNNGSCSHPAKANGTACTDDGNSCTSDSCTAGVCTHPNKLAGSACGNSAAGLCDNPDTCNGSGVCLTNSLPNGSACADDGNECTNDTCSNGTCTHPAKANGTACTNDGNSCTSDTCNNGTCSHPAVANGTACVDDGNSCTNDSCSNGVCAHPAKANGTACADDGNSCTTDSCSAGVCTHPARPNGTACAPDTNQCTNDVCTAGVCTHPNKPAGSSCGSSTSGPCDNPDTCNGSGVCLANSRPNGTACPDDGNACTNDVCSSAVCTHPPKPNGTLCADADLCDGQESCQAGTCAPGAPLVCVTKDLCEVSVCVPAVGCVNEPVVCPNGEPCVDGDCQDAGCNNDGVCDAWAGEDCISCPTDCRGRQYGPANKQFCCGDGDGVNPLGCESAVCNGRGWLCDDGSPRR